MNIGELWSYENLRRQEREKDEVKKRIMESAERIRDALDIDREAICVKYMDRILTTHLFEDRYSVCNGILEDARTRVIILSAETCSCTSGRFHLRLSEE